MGNSKIRRMCMDGMLVGIFVVLAKLTIPAGPVRIAFSGLATVFATCYFGLADGLIVALLGETIIQLTSSYGIGPTTPLWLWSPSFRALVLGLIDLPFRRKGKHLDEHYVYYGLASILAGLMVTLANAGTEYLDALIIGYPFAVTLPILGMRVVSSLASCAAVAVLSLPLIRAIRKSQGDPLLRAFASKNALKQYLDGDAKEDERGDESGPGAQPLGQEFGEEHREEAQGERHDADEPKE